MAWNLAGLAPCGGGRRQLRRDVRKKRQQELEDGRMTTRIADRKGFSNVYNEDFMEVQEAGVQYRSYGKCLPLSSNEFK